MAVDFAALNPGLEILDACYEGEQSLSYMHPELLRRLDTRVRQVVINWPPRTARCGSCRRPHFSVVWATNSASGPTARQRAQSRIASVTQ